MPPEAVSLSDFIKRENIICNLPSISRDDVVKQLVTRLVKNEGGFKGEAATYAVLDREKVSATVIAPGIALPHARLVGLEAPIVAIATSGKGIDFEAENEEPVNVIILVLTPKSDPGVYLRLMAAVSKALSVPRMRKRLAVATSSEQVAKLLAEGEAALPAYLTARNIMDPNPITLAEGDTLAAVIEAFSVNRLMDIPIVDEDGDLRGLVALEDVLRLSLPEHLLWMEDLSPILHFEPFAELLRKDEETKVADFMREDYVSIHPDTPAIQLAKMFLRNRVRQIQVMEGRHFVGVVNVENFVAQLFWA
jgi:mannitol/fructose-specific phosphotransferase system IIA component (Ntr-type)